MDRCVMDLKYANLKVNNIMSNNLGNCSNHDRTVNIKNLATVKVMQSRFLKNKNTGNVINDQTSMHHNETTNLLQSTKNINDIPFYQKVQDETFPDYIDNKFEVESHPNLNCTYKISSRKPRKHASHFNPHYNSFHSNKHGNMSVNLKDVNKCNNYFTSDAHKIPISTKMYSEKAAEFKQNFANKNSIKIHDIVNPKIDLKTTIDKNENCVWNETKFERKKNIQDETLKFPHSGSHVQFKVCKTKPKDKMTIFTVKRKKSLSKIKVKSEDDVYERKSHSFKDVNNMPVYNNNNNYSSNFNSENDIKVTSLKVLANADILNNQPKTNPKYYSYYKIKNNFCKKSYKNNRRNKSSFEVSLNNHHKNETITKVPTDHSQMHNKQFVKFTTNFKYDFDSGNKEFGDFPNFRSVNLSENLKTFPVHKSQDNLHNKMIKISSKPQCSKYIKQLKSSNLQLNNDTNINSLHDKKSDIKIHPCLEDKASNSLQNGSNIEPSGKFFKIRLNRGRRHGSVSKDMISHFDSKSKGSNSINLYNKLSPQVDMFKYQSKVNPEASFAKRYCERPRSGYTPKISTESLSEQSLLLEREIFSNNSGPSCSSTLSDSECLFSTISHTEEQEEAVNNCDSVALINICQKPYSKKRAMPLKKSNDKSQIKSLKYSFDKGYAVKDLSYDSDIETEGLDKKPILFEKNDRDSLPNNSGASFSSTLSDSECCISVTSGISHAGDQGETINNFSSNGLFNVSQKPYSINRFIPINKSNNKSQSKKRVKSSFIKRDNVDSGSNYEYEIKSEGLIKKSPLLEQKEKEILPYNLASDCSSISATLPGISNAEKQGETIIDCSSTGSFNKNHETYSENINIPLKKSIHKHQSTISKESEGEIKIIPEPNLELAHSIEYSNTNNPEINTNYKSVLKLKIMSIYSEADEKMEEGHLESHNMVTDENNDINLKVTSVESKVAESEVSGEYNLFNNKIEALHGESLEKYKINSKDRKNICISKISSNPTENEENKFKNTLKDNKMLTASSKSPLRIELKELHAFKKSNINSTQSNLENYLNQAADNQTSIIEANSESNDNLNNETDLHSLIDLKNGMTDFPSDDLENSIDSFLIPKISGFTTVTNLEDIKGNVNESMGKERCYKLSSGNVNSDFNYENEKEITIDLSTLNKFKPINEGLDVNNDNRSANIDANKHASACKPSVDDGDIHLGINRDKESTCEKISIEKPLTQIDNKDYKKPPELCQSGDFNTTLESNSETINNILLLEDGSYSDIKDCLNESMNEFTSFSFDINKVKCEEVSIKHENVDGDFNDLPSTVTMGVVDGHSSYVPKIKTENLENSLKKEEAGTVSSNIPDYDCSLTSGILLSDYTLKEPGNSEANLKSKESPKASPTIKYNVNSNSETKINDLSEKNISAKERDNLPNNFGKNCSNTLSDSECCTFVPSQRVSKVDITIEKPEKSQNIDEPELKTKNKKKSKILLNELKPLRNNIIVGIKRKDSKKLLEVVVPVPKKLITDKLPFLKQDKTPKKGKEMSLEKGIQLKDVKVALFRNPYLEKLFCGLSYKKERLYKINDYIIENSESAIKLEATDLLTQFEDHEELSVKMEPPEIVKEELIEEMDESSLEVGYTEKDSVFNCPVDELEVLMFDRVPQRRNQLKNIFPPDLESKNIGPCNTSIINDTEGHEPLFEGFKYSCDDKVIKLRTILTKIYVDSSGKSCNASLVDDDEEEEEGSILKFSDNETSQEPLHDKSSSDVMSTPKIPCVLSELSTDSGSLLSSVASSKQIKKKFKKKLKKSLWYPPSKNSQKKWRIKNLKAGSGINKIILEALHPGKGDKNVAETKGEDFNQRATLPESQEDSVSVKSKLSISLNEETFPKGFTQSTFPEGKILNRRESNEISPSKKSIVDDKEKIQSDFSSLLNNLQNNHVSDELEESIQNAHLNTLETYAQQVVQNMKQTDVNEIKKKNLMLHGWKKSNKYLPIEKFNYTHYLFYKLRRGNNRNHCKGVALRNYDLYLMSNGVEYKCFICSQLCNTKEYLSTHLMNHKIDKVFCCQFCEGKSTHNIPSNYSFGRNGEEVYKCVNCDFVSSCISHLNIHFYDHFKGLPFVCKLCKYRAKYLSEMERHLVKSHSKNKLKVSHYKTFSRDNHPKEKAANVYTKVQLNSFQCPLCYYCNAETEEEMILHINGHENCDSNLLHCQSCKFNTQSAVDMMRHLEKHLNVRKLRTRKKLACYVCSKSYKRLKSLHNHMTCSHKIKINPFWDKSIKKDSEKRKSPQLSLRKCGDKNLSEVGKLRKRKSANDGSVNSGESLATGSSSFCESGAEVSKMSRGNERSRIGRAETNLTEVKLPDTKESNISPKRNHERELNSPSSSNLICAMIKKGLDKQNSDHAESQDLEKGLSRLGGNDIRVGTNEVNEKPKALRQSDSSLRKKGSEYSPHSPKKDDKSSNVYSENRPADVNFKCNYCDFESDKLFKLNDHLVNHSELNPFQCNFCPRTFPNSNLLTMHIIKHTKNNKS